MRTQNTFFFFFKCAHLFVHHVLSVSAWSCVFMVVCFVSMCNVSSWGEGKCLVFFLFHWGLSDWRCLRFTALRLCLCAGAAEVILLVCSPGGSLSSRPASGCSHNPLASHTPSPPTNPTTAVLATAAHCSSRYYYFICCDPTHRLWPPPHRLWSSSSFLCKWGTMFEWCRKIQAPVWIWIYHLASCILHGFMVNWNGSHTCSVLCSLMAPQPHQSSAQNSFHASCINTKTFDLSALIFCVLLHFKHLN